MGSRGKHNKQRGARPNETRELTRGMHTRGNTGDAPGNHGKHDKPAGPIAGGPAGPNEPGERTLGDAHLGRTGCHGKQGEPA